MKKIFIRKTALITGLSIFIHSIAQAEIPLPYGWYVEGNAGQSQLSNKSYADASSTKNTGFGWNVNAGYKFMTFFAMEMGYTNYYHTNIEAPSGSTAGQDNHYSYQIDLKGIWPIVDSGAELFAKLGATHIKSMVSITNTTAANSISLVRSSHTGVGLFFGLGGDYNFTPQFAVN